VDDYGLDYSAAFVGCSADTEASFETVRFLAEKVDEKKLNNILVIENSTAVRSSGQPKPIKREL